MRNCADAAPNSFDSALTRIVAALARLVERRRAGLTVRRQRIGSGLQERLHDPRAYATLRAGDEIDLRHPLIDKTS